ncbi:hypothetical protein [Pseudalkalibacillus berkeleyi]|uniref:Uncharacterized protein n=1 Tax=Pseudalkalibacillus berkeleyi TaxID=1069813 RepID=A0ABS9H4J9_9BACL|nr:hypothetical protein [Pseudalkalibacillus berkeleyi]MCF6138846.1 hypothetical protein [Pseudalkalibacillus berkeleyi]
MLIVFFFVLGGVLLYINALPIIDMTSNLFNIFSSAVNKETNIENEVEEYLENKYNLQFKVNADVDFEQGTSIAAYPVNESSYIFSVEETKNGTYMDNFIGSLYKHQIISALKRYPTLSNNDSIRIITQFDPKATMGKTYDFHIAYPSLSDRLAVPYLKLSGNQEGDDINREEVFEWLKSMITFIQKENIPHNELNATITVKAPDVYYYYTYTIPKDAFPKFQSIEDIKAFEKVKAVKPQP